MTQKASSKKRNHTYIVRKVVFARDMKEALANERKGKLLDIVLIRPAKADQLVPMVGFAPSETHERDEGDNEEE